MYSKTSRGPNQWQIYHIPILGNYVMDRTKFNFEEIWNEYATKSEEKDTKIIEILGYCEIGSQED